MHDTTLDRTTNCTGSIADVTYACISFMLFKTNHQDVSTCDAGSWFSPEFAGTPVPTFSEAVELAKVKEKLYI